MRGRRSPREGRRRPPPPASSDANQDVRHVSKIPAEHRQPDTEITSGGGDEPDGVGTDSASPWDTVEDDGGADMDGRWKAAVVLGTAADGVDADGGPGDGEPPAADRPIVVRPVSVLSSAGAAVARAGRPTRPRGDGSGGAAAARAATARAAAVERGRRAFARFLGARSVGMRGSFLVDCVGKEFFHPRARVKS